MSDVVAVRVAFALESEQYLVDQFDSLGWSRSALEHYLGRSLEDHLLTSEEQERLIKHLGEVRKAKAPGATSPARLDGKPRRTVDGKYLWPDGLVTETDTRPAPPAPRRPAGPRR